MRRRKLFALALIVLSAGAGVYFFGLRADEALHAEINRTLRMSDGSVNIFFSITNQSYRSGHFIAYPQILTNGQWLLDDSAGKPIGTGGSLPAYASLTPFVRASSRPGSRRLQIRYQLAKSPGREKCDQLLQKIHMGPIPYRSQPREITTPPFEFPAH